MTHTQALRLPDFIAVGPVRTGTTWLDGVFRGQIGLPAGIKETQFFGWRYQLGIDWYERHFLHCPANLISGEFGPTYFFAEVARQRIARHIPDCKIICTLREPVERIYSHYKLWRKLAIIKEPFEQAIERNPELFTRTAYTPQVKAWQARFGRDRTLVLIYEDSRQARQAYIDRICDFIGAPRFDLRTIVGERRLVAHFERAPRSRRLARRARLLKDEMEVRGYARTRRLLEPALELCMGGGEPFAALDTGLAATLRARFAPDIAELEHLLERDLSLWREAQPGGASVVNAQAG